MMWSKTHYLFIYLRHDNAQLYRSKKEQWLWKSQVVCDFSFFFPLSYFNCIVLLAKGSEGSQFHNCINKYNRNCTNKYNQYYIYINI